MACDFSAALFTVPFIVTTPRTVSTSMLRAFTSSSAARVALTLPLMVASEMVVTGPRAEVSFAATLLPPLPSLKAAQPLTPRASAAHTASAYDVRSILMLSPSGLGRRAADKPEIPCEEGRSHAFHEPIRTQERAFRRRHLAGAAGDR